MQKKFTVIAFFSRFIFQLTFVPTFDRSVVEVEAFLGERTGLVMTHEGPYGKM